MRVNNHLKKKIYLKYTYQNIDDMRCVSAKIFPSFVERTRILDLNIDNKSNGIENMEWSVIRITIRNK